MVNGQAESWVAAYPPSSPPAPSRSWYESRRECPTCSATSSIVGPSPLSLAGTEPGAPIEYIFFRGPAKVVDFAVDTVAGSIAWFSMGATPYSEEEKNSIAENVIKPGAKVMINVGLFAYSGYSLIRTVSLIRAARTGSSGTGIALVSEPGERTEDLCRRGGVDRTCNAKRRRHCSSDRASGCGAGGSSSSQDEHARRDHCDRARIKKRGRNVS